MKLSIKEKLEIYLKDCLKKDRIPLIKEVCTFNDILLSELNELAQEDEEIEKIIKKINQAQEVLVQRKWANSEINQNYAKSALEELGWGEDKDKEPKTFNLIIEGIGAEKEDSEDE